MKSKIIALILVFALSATLCLCGCDNFSIESMLSSEDYADQEISNEIRKSVVINGKQYTFPFSVSKLGKDYSLENFKYSNENQISEYYNSATADLYYNGADIATVYFDDITRKERESGNTDFSRKKIEGIEQSDALDEINGCYIEIMGLKVGDDKDKVTEILGEPYETRAYSYGKVGSFYYDKEEALTPVYLSANYTEDSISYISLGIYSTFYIDCEKNILLRESTDLYSDYDFDYIDISKDTAIDGHKFAFPFTIEELGEDFSLGEITFNDGQNLDGTYSSFATMYYKDESLGSVYFSDPPEKLEERKSEDYTKKEVEIFSQLSYGEPIIYFLESNGIKIGDDVEKITNTLGTPTEQRINNTENCLIYRTSYDNYISVEYMCYNNKVSKITLVKK